MVLAFIALFAAAVSALTGVAGGVLLLSGLILMVPPLAVVPLHGVVQFCAGATRMVVYGKSIVWSVVVPFVLAMLPGSALGAYGLSILQSINPSWVLLAIAAVILSTALPSVRPKPEEGASRSGDGGLLALGFVCGFLGMFVGSTGPLVSGWLLRRGILKEAHIGSKSVMQGSAHLAKVPLFIWGLDFDFGPYLVALIMMAIMVAVGTLIGRWALNRISPVRFAFMIRVLLGLIVVRIVITEVPKLI